MTKKKNVWCLTVFLCFFSVVLQISAQEVASGDSNVTVNSSFLRKQSNQTSNSNERPFEIGFHFTSLSRNGDGDRNGFGGRFGYQFATFNGGKYTATAEAELNYFTGDNFTASLRRNGRVFQGLFGAKVGRRFDKFGIFGKVRPGFNQYSKGKVSFTGTSTNPQLITRAETNFATDFGGVLEFYPSKRLTTRFDFGDTIVRFGRQNISSTFGTTFSAPAETKHNFQFSAGIGWRF